MYQNEKILALIPARGGSKGIKNKNIVDLNGKPLIAYSIDSANESKYIDRTVVTTDSERIAEVSKQYGADVPFMRPKELATDTATTLEAVLHAIAELKREGNLYDVLVLLQPTQPLRTSEEIDRAIEVFFEHKKKALVSVSEVDTHPILIRSIDENGRLVRLLQASSTCRRQDMPPFYQVNGCIYINQINEINETTSFNDNEIPFLMQKKDSVDIDTMEDLQYARYILGDNR